MAYDPVRRQTVLFGGTADGGMTALDEMWSWDGSRWSELQPLQRPTARSYAAIAFDLQTQRILLFGGATATGYLNDTWEWDGANWNQRLAGGTTPLSFGDPLMAYDAARSCAVLYAAGRVSEWNGSTWLPRTAQTNPPARMGAAMTYDFATAKTVLFGGLSSQGTRNDTWTWDGVDWQGGPAQSLPSRAWTAMAFDWSRGRPVIVGGRHQPTYGGPSSALADAWEWDGTLWQPLSATPPAREGAMLAFDPLRARLVMYGGGTSPFINHGDVWERDSTAWTQVDPGVALPPPTFARMAYDEQRGRTLLQAGDDSTWEFDGSRWRAVAQGAGPGPRTGYALAYDRARNRTVLFGGAPMSPGPLVFFDDTWEWDGMAWTRRFPAVSPPARNYAAMAYDVRRQRTVLFGGMARSDTWEWDGNTWQQVGMGSGPVNLGTTAMAYDERRGRIVLVAGQTVGETWEWDGNTWTQRMPLVQPVWRNGQSMAYDGLRDRIVMFGGSDTAAAYLDELWEWDGTDWRQRSGAHPSPRLHAAMAFDSGRGQVLLFGGFYGITYFRESWIYRTDRPAAFAPFGAGCAGSVGVPVLRCAPGMLAWLGDTLRLELQGVAAGAGAVLGFGFDTVSWNGLPLPASLAPFGMPGCLLHVGALGVSALRLAGQTAWDVPVPGTASLAGWQLHFQGLVLDPSVGNAARAAVSNAGTVTVGVR